MKTYNVKFNIGRCKYLVCYHNGVKTHQDGSPFLDVRLFTNKVKLNTFEKELKAQGYIYL